MLAIYRPDAYGGSPIFSSKPQRVKTAAAVLAAASLLTSAGCSGNAGSAASSQQPAASSAPAAAANPTDFPLVDGATVIAERPFTQVVDPAMLRKGAAFSQGAGTYAGVQVIAKTGATLPELAAWMRAQTADPPAGYAALDATQLNDAHEMASKYGLDFAAFSKDVAGVRHVVLLVALDPDGLDARLGPAIGLVKQFASLPEVVRGPIDAQIQKRTGMTATEMLDPGSPLGAALAAYDSVKSTGSRALVLVDASKQ